MKRGRYGLIPRTESAYDVMGLDPSMAQTYTDADISRAYRRASLTAHPDKPTGSQTAFDRLQEAYSLVRTHEKRQLYAKYGSRLEEGPGDHMRETMALAVPVGLGILGGITFVMAATVVHRGPTTHHKGGGILAIIPMVTIGTCTLLFNDAPVLSVIRTSAGGMVVGSAVTGAILGMGVFVSRLLYGSNRPNSPLH